METSHATLNVSGGQCIGRFLDYNDTVDIGLLIAVNSFVSVI